MRRSMEATGAVGSLNGVGDVGKRTKLAGRGQRKVQHLRAVRLRVHDELAHGNRSGTTLGTGLVEA